MLKKLLGFVAQRNKNEDLAEGLNWEEPQGNRSVPGAHGKIKC